LCYVFNSQLPTQFPVYNKGAVCCSVLQYFTLYCSVLQCVALCSQQSARCPNFVYIIGLQSAAVRCYELQCVAVRCRVLNNQLATQLPVERSNAAVHLTHGPMSTIISIRCKQFLTVENTLQHTATHCNILQHTAHTAAANVYISQDTM